MAKNLVIWDLSGVWIRKLRKPKDTTNLYKLPWYYIYVRPGITDLIKLLINDYDCDIAVWTSNPKDRTEVILKKLASISDDWQLIIEQLLFVWTREQCDINGFLGTKDLNKVEAQYGHCYQRIVMIDDEDCKIVNSMKVNYLAITPLPGKDYGGSYVSKNEEQEIEEYTCNIFFSELLLQLGYSETMAGITNKVFEAIRRQKEQQQPVRHVDVDKSDFDYPGKIKELRTLHAEVVELEKARRDKISSRSPKTTFENIHKEAHQEATVALNKSKEQHRRELRDIEIQRKQKGPQIPKREQPSWLKKNITIERQSFSSSLKQKINDLYYDGDRKAAAKLARKSKLCPRVVQQGTTKAHICCGKFYKYQMCNRHYHIQNRPWVNVPRK